MLGAASIGTTLGFAQGDRRRCWPSADRSRSRRPARPADIAAAEAEQRHRASAAWPGMIHAGSVIAGVADRDRHLVAVASFSRSAIAGESSSGLSQVSLVSGRGSSCSQALLAKRPSQMRVGAEQQRHARLPAAPDAPGCGRGA